MATPEPSSLSRRKWLQLAALTGGAIGLAPIAASASRNESRAARGLVGCTDEFYPESPAGAAPLIRLGANENPYGPSEAARLAASAALSSGCRYAYAAAMDLAASIAAREGVSPNQVLVGAGSKDLLALIALSLAGKPGGQFVSPDPTYNFLLTAGEGISVQWDRVKLTDTHHVDLAALAGALTDSTRLVYLCNPHNPTGTYLPSAKLHSSIREVSQKTTVVVDEAYIEFIPEANYESCVPLVKQGNNVMVVRTFSKVHGMAGLRVGYVISTPDNIARLTRVATVPAMNLSVASVAAAKASLKDVAFMADVVRRNAEVREAFVHELSAMGIRSIPSVANFVAFELPEQKADFKKAMVELGYAVNDFAYRNATYGRVSIGNQAEMAAFVPVLRKWWQAT